MGCKGPTWLPYNVVLALTPLFLTNVILSGKLAKMIEAREKEQKKKQNRQGTIANAK